MARSRQPSTSKLLAAVEGLHRASDLALGVAETGRLPPLGEGAPRQRAGWLEKAARRLQEFAVPDENDDTAPRTRRRAAFLVLWGSLNPVHMGHLSALEAAAEVVAAKTNAPVIAGFLAPSLNEEAPEKDQPDFAERRHLCSLACADSDWIEACPWGRASSSKVVRKICKRLQERFLRVNGITWEFEGWQIASADSALVLPMKRSSPQTVFMAHDEPDRCLVCSYMSGCEEDKKPGSVLIAMSRHPTLSSEEVRGLMSAGHWDRLAERGLLAPAVLEWLRAQGEEGEPGRPRPRAEAEADEADEAAGKGYSQEAKRTREVEDGHFAEAVVIAADVCHSSEATILEGAMENKDPDLHPTEGPDVLQPTVSANAPPIALASRPGVVSGIRPLRASNGQSSTASNAGPRAAHGDRSGSASGLRPARDSRPEPSVTSGAQPGIARGDRPGSASRPRPPRNSSVEPSMARDARPDSARGVRPGSASRPQQPRDASGEPRFAPGAGTARGDRPGSASHPRLPRVPSAEPPAAPGARPGMPHGGRPGSASHPQLSRVPSAEPGTARGDRPGPRLSRVPSAEPPGARPGTPRGDRPGSASRPRLPRDPSAEPPMDSGPRPRTSRGDRSASAARAPPAPSAKPSLASGAGQDAAQGDQPRSPSSAWLPNALAALPGTASGSRPGTACGSRPAAASGARQCPPAKVSADGCGRGGVAIGGTRPGTPCSNMPGLRLDLGAHRKLSEGSFFTTREARRRPLAGEEVAGPRSCRGMPTQSRTKSKPDVGIEAPRRPLICVNEEEDGDEEFGLNQGLKLRKPSTPWPRTSSQPSLPTGRPAAEPKLRLPLAGLAPLEPETGIQGPASSRRSGRCRSSASLGTGL